MSATADPSFLLFPYKEGFVLLRKPSVLRLYYKNHSVDLLSSQKGEGIGSLLKSLDEKTLSKKDGGFYALHLFYELGFLFQRLDDYITGDIPLAIEMEFAEQKLVSWQPGEKNIRLKKVSEVSFERYHQSFLKGKNHLLNGDCYQYNLTIPFVFETTSLPLDILSQLWKKPATRGAYGTYTWLAPLKQALISNSPECLFQLGSNGVIESMPIKGSLSTMDRPWQDAWNELCESRKNENELNMITDLIRNDLSKIAMTPNKVKALKSPLRVPGIIHSYSRVQTTLPMKTSLRSILEALFPGGSITGAPKKRVMEILSQLENRERGFYCGSTVLWFDELRAASINIRSALYEVEKGLLEYQAGGGITFRSDPKEEYEEAGLKAASFLTLLKSQK